MLPCLFRKTTSLRAHHVSLICIRPFQNNFLKSNWINFGRTLLNFTRWSMSGQEDSSVIIETLRSSVKEQVFINQRFYCMLPE